VKEEGKRLSVLAKRGRNSWTTGSKFAIAGSRKLESEGNRNIYIGNQGVAQESGAIRIGYQSFSTSTYINGIYGATEPSGLSVVVGPDGHLGTVSSSQRFKEQIKPMDNASEAIMALRPVTFQYKSDKQNTPQFGLIAEEVAKVNPDLVVRDDKSEIYTVRYEAVNAMLLNEFLKEHLTVQELKAGAQRQEAIIAQQQKQIEALTAGLQKVTAAVESNNPLPRVVSDN
jgi:trimeric autotransporter adhesin